VCGVLQAAVSEAKQAAAEAAVQELDRAAAKHGAKGVTAIVALLNWD